MELASEVPPFANILLTRSNATHESDKGVPLLFSAVRERCALFCGTDFIKEQQRTAESGMWIAFQIV